MGENGEGPALEESTLQDQVDQQSDPTRRRYGTFAGVFTPTFLTIVGVILYLREGWVVGNAGLLGAWIIISLAYLITTCTALSMSCITTNIRIGAGGAYSIIAQSLGLEVGGSVGIPLYLAQALAAAMYIFGFREGWTWIFPDHPALLVDMATFGTMFLIAWISTKLAFRVQYLILAIVIASLVSIVLSVFQGALQYDITWWGEFPGAPEDGFPGVSFWVVFAVFFPAATGIMAGANMSGELANPRRSLPSGTLWAIGISYLIYMAGAWWVAQVAPVEELISNYTVMVDYAAWGPAVLAGILGATFSSGLASVVGAPRILQALGKHQVFPLKNWLAQVSKGGEPRNAMWFTGIVVLIGVLFRDLNAIAPLITMFFLITYGMINVVVLIEQSLNMVSFRPVFSVPRVVPLLGTLGCLLAMFIISPLFGLAAIGVGVGVYAYLVRQHVPALGGDIRSGLFFSVAEWAAKQVADLPAANERAWKPSLLVPVEDTRELRGTFNLIRNLTYPRGAVKLVGLTSQGRAHDLHQRLPQMSSAFGEEGIFTRWSVVEAEHFDLGVISSMQTLSGTFFRPNILFLKLTSDETRDEAISNIYNKAREHSMGIQIFADDPVARLGRRRHINVWVTDQSPDWSLSMDLGNKDLALLTAHKLQQNWGGKARLLTAVRDEQHVDDARDFLNNLLDLARLKNVEVIVEHCDFRTALSRAPQSDVDLFGLGQELNFEFMREMVEATRSACLFVRDSGSESIMA